MLLLPLLTLLPIAGREASVIVGRRVLLAVVVRRCGTVTATRTRAPTAPLVVRRSGGNRSRQFALLAVPVVRADPTDARSGWRGRGSVSLCAPSPWRRTVCAKIARFLKTCEKWTDVSVILIHLTSPAP